MKKFSVLMFLVIAMLFVFTSCQKDEFLSVNLDMKNVKECVEPPKELQGENSQWLHPRYVRLFKEDIESARYIGKFGIAISDSNNPNLTTVTYDDVFWVNARVDWGFFQGVQYVSYPTLYSISATMLDKAKKKIAIVGYATGYKQQEYQTYSTDAGVQISWIND